MNSGMASFGEIKTLAFDQVPSPKGIMSIFAGGVFWENVDTFENNCIQETEHALKRLLEMRVYSETCEFHAIRDSIDETRLFSWRTICDGDYEFFDDDDQFLDIDAGESGKPNGFHYQTMSGGSYELPVDNASKVRIRNYLDYDEDGLVHVVDFRIVDLLREGDA